MILQSCSLNRPLLSCKGKTTTIQAEKLLPLSMISRNLSSFSLSFRAFPALSFLGLHCINRSESRCYRMVVAKLSGDDRENGNSAEIGGKPRPKRRFSMRLRPRLRLISAKLKRISLRSLIEDAVFVLRKNSKKVTLSTVISLAMGFCFLLLKFTAVPMSKVVPYSDLVSNLQTGKVSTVLFEEGSRRIFFNTMIDSQDSSKPEEENSSVKIHSNPVLSSSSWSSRSVPKWQYVTRKIDHDENFLLGLMREAGTTYSSAPQSALASMRNILITIISLWVPLTPLMWLLYRQLSSASNIAKKRRPSNQTVSFDDVEGVDAAKEELMEIVSCLQGSLDYSKLGAKLLRGVLLVGPPGTGKTLLARAVAGEAGVPFFSVSASEFVEMFVGRGAARIRELFNTAKKCVPSIIFIDELDAVGGKRGRSFNDERDQTLNQLLTEMDGFESDMKVIVIAATNRPEALDPALCRPGRFSRKVLVGEPDLEGRKNILAVHVRGVPLEEEPLIICNLVASLTPGFVGADLANIVNEAALLAARRGGETVCREDFLLAIERAKFGINEKPLSPIAIKRSISKWFPWMPALLRKDGTGEDGLHNLMGYQTLS
ncbi:probable inactive ATP-dependent zinc metalloprotease FTSHI 3, chloroplastic isoform X1 [Phalaenopsis equestris]|uniref:probable inactive ATP-dependent zinc metalloprotease FTSHI 3, chloroplastic isoform X1 n=2 Tax=Phalaenopsis equestris TaxID=78828 RepID=UPI0009E38D81|nr:probable inactive ATP-dependent zinc metalloprotease FTSHI 3, chloroplastic isoform X1 [Phalaenopsis equestris]XP_020573890.1 probable inactive ATP-dependent zinc metalloprotease FTSHI 3, chloroplastic isoform X1 [Phalaenopsis equestris]